MQATTLFPAVPGAAPAPQAGSLAVPQSLMEKLSISIFHNKSFWIGMGAMLLICFVLVMAYNMFVRTPAATEADIRTRLYSEFETKVKSDTMKAEIISFGLKVDSLEKKGREDKEEISKLQVKLAECHREGCGPKK